MQTNSVEFAGGRLGSDRHVCAFFHSPEEERRVLRSFVREGFDRRERAVHIVDPERYRAHAQWLEETGVNINAATISGQLELLSWTESYLCGDRFNQDDMLALLEGVLVAGAAGGYPLTRLVAHMEWACSDKPGVADLVEYETRLNFVLPKFADPVICTYDLSRFSAGVAMDILRTHPVILIGGMLRENPLFVPPDQFLMELRDRTSSTNRQVTAAKSSPAAAARVGEGRPRPAPANLPWST